MTGDSRRLERIWPTLFLAAASGALFATVCLRVEDSFEKRWRRLPIGATADAATALLGEPTRRLDRRDVRVPDGLAPWTDDRQGEWWLYDVSGDAGAEQHLLWMQDSQVAAKRRGRSLQSP